MDARVEEIVGDGDPVERACRRHRAVQPEAAHPDRPRGKHACGKEQLACRPAVPRFLWSGAEMRDRPDFSNVYVPSRPTAGRQGRNEADAAIEGGDWAAFP